ncbi:hypothetical protein MKW92_028028 [Papaver armeniacum]|nr:hypothetical protein MKW92_028028 [Papaver armeniacum]
MVPKSCSDQNSQFSSLIRQRISIGSVTISKRGYLQGPGKAYFKTLKPRPLSTSAADTAQGEGDKQVKKISVIIVDKDGEETKIMVPIGMSDTHMYNNLEGPTDAENDMLDLAFGLTETSRLGCQVIARPELDGIRLALPAATRILPLTGTYKTTLNILKGELPRSINMIVLIETLVNTFAFVSVLGRYEI